MTAHQIDGLEGITAISSSHDNLIALKDDGTVCMIGNNCYGQLGNDAGYGDPYSYVISPVRIKGLTGIIAVYMGEKHAVALKNDGTVWAWGRDDCGQLGDGASGPFLYRNVPVEVPFSVSLAGPAVAPEWMVPLRPAIPAVVEAPQNDMVIDMAAGDNGLCYAFTANGLTAFSRDNRATWNLTIPGRWTYDTSTTRIISAAPDGSILGAYEKSLPIFAMDGGNIYLYAIASASDASYTTADPIPYSGEVRSEVEKELIAVSPDGKIAWNRTFYDDICTGDASHIERPVP